MNKKNFMLAFMPNITNKLRILLKFPRTPCNNKNAADRGQGPPNSTSSEIDDIEWFRKKWNVMYGLKIEDDLLIH